MFFDKNYFSDMEKIVCADTTTTCFDSYKNSFLVFNFNP